ncbi:MAG TPA: hypothetical protein VGK73_11305 [Polyangiaceae bacterium]
MVGPFGTHSARRAELVDISSTDDDFVISGEPPRAVYVGGAGNLSVRMAGGSTVVFTAVPAGTLLPISISRVVRATTTATTILVLY